MAVSMAVVPLLKGEEAKAILRDFEASKMRIYSVAERKATDEKVAEILKQKYEVYRRKNR